VLPEARIVAVDVLRVMVDEANRRITVAGFENRVLVVVGDLGAPPVDPESQDLIWCEGAIYQLGVTEALRVWRSLLKPGGTVAFTEPIWLVDAPPKEIHDWWSSEYPAISDAAGVEARIRAASYRTVASFVLPASAWWDEYYGPMQDRIASLRQRLPDDPIAGEVVAAAEVEIDHFRRFSDCYSYTFFVVQPTG
jgi:SAM-dependent methyltransferase